MQVENKQIQGRAVRVQALYREQAVLAGLVFFFFGLVSVANILKSYETSYKVRHQTLPLTN